MPRKPRRWYPGAIYHVICRGNHQKEIFRDDFDRRVYLERLFHAIEEHNCTLLSYCLMRNHVHLQIATADVVLWKMMQNLNSRYVRFHNRKYDLVGHLFQGRYRAELIDNDLYNLQVSRYIHLNPVAAKIVKSPTDYPWSSYRDYLGLGVEPIATPGPILSYFCGASPDLYRCFVETQDPQEWPDGLSSK